MFQYFKKLRKKFFDLGIQKKMWITNVGIILIMILLLGIMDYFVVQRLLTNMWVTSSVDLIEQLGDNYDYQISAINDFVLSQTFDSNLNQYLLKDYDGSGNKEKYNSNRYFSSFSYNLMNYNKYINMVMITNSNHSFSYCDYNMEGITQSEVEQIVHYDQVSDLKGGMLWQPFNNQMILASRTLFDKNSMQEMGTITIGVDVEYFKKQSKNIVKDKFSKIVLLNGENEVLIQSDDEVGEVAKLIVERYRPIKNMQQQIYYNNKPYIFVTWYSQANAVWVMNLIDKGIILKEVAEALRPMIYIAVLAVILSGFIAFLISSKIAKTIYLLLERTKEIARGDFTTQINPEFNDEIGTLALAFNHMCSKICELIEAISNEKVKQQNAQLKSLQFEYDSLQAKINPHFLYNTLESINSLAKLNGEKEIAESIYLLGNYLRETISNKKKFICLAEEIQNIKDYIKIQKVSYQDKINISFCVDEALMDAVVPKLILQPLVENAIVHGIEPKLEKGIIHVWVKCCGKDMKIEISDDGVGIEGSKLENGLLVVEDNDSKHTKVGVMSVHKRLQILYGNDYGLHIESEEQKGTNVLLMIPIRFEGEMDEEI